MQIEFTKETLEKLDNALRLYKEREHDDLFVVDTICGFNREYVLKDNTCVTVEMWLQQYTTHNHTRRYDLIYRFNIDNTHKLSTTFKDFYIGLYSTDFIPITLNDIEYQTKQTFDYFMSNPLIDTISDNLLEI